MNSIDLTKVKWIHGSPDCSVNPDPYIQVVKYNENTWILRQNKCIHYEAPFMYLFFGRKKALLVDTGATGEEKIFPLYYTVQHIKKDFEEKNNSSIELLVVHTHNHQDHTAGDIQFEGKSNTTIVGKNIEEVINFFGFKNWPKENAIFDLGNKVMEIIPTPGHEPSSIAFYDSSSQFLLSGDTFYPGRLYISDWVSYKSTINKLLNFTKFRNVLYLLGNHIEMSIDPGKDYPIGTKYQPNEHRLPLYVEDLKRLQNALESMGTTPIFQVHDSFIIYPI